ncbi:MAG: 4Fe-4S binding protein [Halanaerobiaceae bacterium]|jgi:iron only hydrogenase large subunit-like protein|nr:4Fe-4S binding protein [Halanaerobiaceae bacterium]
MKKHSVLLNEELCVGCTNCVKNCPTKAIRVHQGKVMIKEELCIDCAECIRTCAYHAKYSETGKLEEMSDYKYPVVMIPPSFYGQFDGIEALTIKQSLLQLGFKKVVDVALAAEALSRKTLDFLNEHSGMFISSSCPVVVRMIMIMYPELLGHLIPLKAPVELMAERVRSEAEAEGIPPEDIGIFFITPCPAKNTTIYNPLGLEKSRIDMTLSVDLVYKALLKLFKEGDKEKTVHNLQSEDMELPYLGINWGQNGGETQLLKENMQDKALSVSGIHNVKLLLDELSINNIKGIKYFELLACNQGCVGGVFNIMNPFQAKYNLLKLRGKHQNWIRQDLDKYNFELESELQQIQIGKLDNDLEKAMEKLAELEREIEVLPGLDCAACGAPDCRTLAEDIVNGKASRNDCIFLLRQQVGSLADRMSELAHTLPPVMKRPRKKT